MIWLVPAILLVCGFVSAVLAQGAATTWLWVFGSISGAALMMAGVVVLAGLFLLVA